MPARLTHHRAELLLAALLCLSAACALALAAPDSADAALQKIAGYKPGAKSPFGQLTEYFNGLRDAIIPLAVPTAAIGLIFGGVVYMAGGHQAGKTLTGVVVGVGLILMAPSLVA